MSFNASERGMGVASMRQMLSKSWFMVFSFYSTPFLRRAQVHASSDFSNVSHDGILADEKRDSSE